MKLNRHFCRNRLDLCIGEASVCNDGVNERPLGEFVGPVLVLLDAHSNMYMGISIGA